MRATGSASNVRSSTRRSELPAVNTAVRCLDGRGAARVRVQHARRARRPAARSVHRRERDADLPDRGIRVRGHGVGVGVLQPAGVRQRLQPDHESDRGRVRGAAREPRGRRRRGRVRERPRRAGRALLRAARAGRPDRGREGALRRLDRAAQPPRAQAPDHRGLGRHGRPGRLAPHRHGRDEGAVRRDDREPGRQRARHLPRRGGRARGRRAARGGQHLRDALPLPAARVRRRPDHPLRHEVHRRQRDDDRGRRRRLGHVRLVERPLSFHRGARRPRTTASSSTRRSASTGS